MFILGVFFSGDACHIARGAYVLILQTSLCRFKTSFLSDTGTDVINAIYDLNLRIGVHLIALPDGSSESGVSVP
jgi:hypothetical protein